QPEYAEAPVLVIATMRLAELTNRGGVRSYLDASMAAGSALHAGWLDMRGRGLEGGIFAGIFPDKSINRLLDGTPWDHRPVLALAVGHPVRLGRGELGRGRWRGRGTHEHSFARRRVLQRC